LRSQQTITTVNFHEFPLKRSTEQHTSSSLDHHALSMAFVGVHTLLRTLLCCPNAMRRRLQRFAWAALSAIHCAASAQNITVSAASSLQPALREVVVAFEAIHPGARVHFNFAASGVLLAQLAHGAPVDVLATADEQTMAQASPWLMPSSVALFARNTLVVATPRTQPARLKTLADLRALGASRIALGSVATVPAGRYAQTALVQAGLWKDLQPRLVFTQSASQTIQYVRHASVAAAFMYKTDALQYPDLVRIDFEVPTPVPVVYAMAPVAASQQPELARRFVAFIQSASAQGVFVHHGFTRP
jgi:molybdate transport system substrate-binding protein